MHISEIYYEKVFPIAPYVNEKVGVKITVDPNDDLDEAFKIAQDTVNGWGYKKMEEERPPHVEYGISYGGGAEVVPMEEEPPPKQPFKIKADPAVQKTYEKAKQSGNEKMIALLENMYDFDAS